MIRSGPADEFGETKPDMVRSVRHCNPGLIYIFIKRLDRNSQNIVAQRGQLPDTSIGHREQLGGEDARLVAGLSLNVNAGALREAANCDHRLRL